VTNLATQETAAPIGIGLLGDLVLLPVVRVHRPEPVLSRQVPLPTAKQVLILNLALLVPAVNITLGVVGDLVPRIVVLLARQSPLVKLLLVVLSVLIPQRANLATLTSLAHVPTLLSANGELGLLALITVMVRLGEPGL